MTDTAALGGAVGGAGAIVLGWSLGAEGMERFPLPLIRRVLAVVVLVAAVLTGLGARYGA
ncbi:MAG: hypothetical protein ACOVQY_10765 [Erythrobacter sp.]